VWYFDQVSKTIHSKKHIIKSWDIQNAGKSNNVQIWNTNSGWWQIFKYVKNSFVNAKSNKVLEVQGNKDQEGQEVGVWNRHNGSNQKWNVKYTDEHDIDEPTKGYNKDFGFYIGRPFYIVSKLPMKRVVDVVGGRWLRLKTVTVNKLSQ